MVEPQLPELVTGVRFPSPTLWGLREKTPQALAKGPCGETPGPSPERLQSEVSVNDEAMSLMRRDGAAGQSPAVNAYDNERALQDLLVESPELIPGVGPASAVEELQLPSGGSVDLVVVSPDGDVTLVECKPRRTRTRCGGPGRRDAVVRARAMGHRGAHSRGYRAVLRHSPLRHL